MKQVISGISGLDEILGGGFIRPSTMLIAGVTGTGKTTITMQSIFNAAKEDEVCMFITAMSEPIAMINNFMSRFSFYNISLMGKGNVKYVSLDSSLIKNGSLAIINEIEKNIELIKPDRIVIDPINVLTCWMNDNEKREFYYDLFTKIKGWNSLVLITSELLEDDIWKDEVSYVTDGIIYLSNEKVRDTRVRNLEILKIRGQAYQAGKHSYRITNNGLTIYPILQAVEKQVPLNERTTTGITGLDKMIEGGLIKGSSTLISGGSGTGKTIMGLQFAVACALKGEPVVFVAFEEEPQIIKNNALTFGWDIEKFENKGLFKIIPCSAHQMDINENAISIKKQIEEISAQHVVIDNINGFRFSVGDGDKLSEHVNVLSKYFRSKNITSIFINEVPELMGSTTISGDGTTFILDNIILLRYIEMESEMKKAISVLKMRGSNHDKEIRELVITKKGIEVKLPFAEYSGLMSGNPVKSPSQAFVEAFKK
jgi:circadian clock protein KaiC